ncbi:MAG: sulfotransferase [Bauldia sp.]|nr:sulfotransferase [Bauldia sp.]
MWLRAGREFAYAMPKDVHAAEFCLPVAVMEFEALFRERHTPAAQASFAAFAAAHPPQRPVFVIGMTRSGTSVLTRLLARTSALANWSEANEMWDPAGYPWEADRVRRPLWSVDPEGYTDALRDQNGGWDGPYYRSVPGICSMYAAAHGGPGARLLNKSPMNALRIDMLLRLFPDAAFVGTVRDPRSVIRSLIDHTAGKLDRHPRSGVRRRADGTVAAYVVDGTEFTRPALIERLCASYALVVNRQLDAFEALDPARKAETAYEDFVADIHGVLRAIDVRLGLDPAARNWQSIPKRQDNRNAKSGLTSDEMVLVEDRCRALIQRLGYD